MPDLAPTGGDSEPKTKMVLLRRQVKSVRARDLPSPVPVRLALGAVLAAGGLTAVWLLGHLGLRLGFAPALALPDLGGGPGDGVADGVRQLRSVPFLVFSLGMKQPLLMMAAFVPIVIPAAALAAARPVRPGGPRPSALAAGLGTFAATLAIVVGVLQVAWIALPWRRELLRPLHAAAGESDWAGGLAVVAGLDALAVVAAILWTVLVFRLPLPRWLRALAATTTILAAVLVTVAFAASSGAAVQVRRPRPIVTVGDGGGGLLLGSTDGRAAVLRLDERTPIVDLRAGDATLRVTGTASVADLMTAATTDG